MRLIFINFHLKLRFWFFIRMSPVPTSTMLEHFYEPMYPFHKLFPIFMCVLWGFSWNLWFFVIFLSLRIFKFFSWASNTALWSFETASSALQFGLIRTSAGDESSREKTLLFSNILVVLENHGAQTAKIVTVEGRRLYNITNSEITLKYALFKTCTVRSTAPLLPYTIRLKHFQQRVKCLVEIILRKHKLELLYEGFVRCKKSARSVKLARKAAASSSGASACPALYAV